MLLPVARLSLVLAMLIALAAPARAELSAARLWEIWRTGAAVAGQSLSAGREEPGQGSLVLHDLRSAVARDGVASETLLAWMRLDEQSDGSVRVTLAEEARVESRFRDAEGREGVLAMRLRQSGAEIVVHETEGGLEQALGAERLALGDLALTLAEVRQDIAFELIAEGLATRQTMRLEPGAPLTSRGSGGARRLVLTFDAAPLASPEARFSLDTEMEAPEWSFDLHAEDAARALSAMSWAGTALRLDIGYAHFLVRVVSGAPGGGAPVTAEMGAEAGRLSLTTEAEGSLVLEARAGPTRGLVAGAGLPLDRLSVTAAESMLRLALPQAAAAGAPFDLALTLSRLLPGPEHAAPGSALAALAGDGARADLALAGRLRGAAGAPSPEIEALRLERLRVSFADAVLRGSGAVTLGDGAEAARPEGDLTFTIDGGDALLQALHGAGIIADNQIMGLRMMMAMFTLPGETPDSAVVTLAFSPEGRILLNGAPLN